MKPIAKIAALLILAAPGLWGQNGAPSAAPVAGRQPSIVATSNAQNLAAAARARKVADQRLQEMGSTLGRMHTLLKQMRANTTGSDAKDPMAKANLEMWNLMLSQLDKQYEELRLAAHARDDLEARRNALYKQAEEKAAAVAKNGRAARAGVASANPTSAQSTPTVPTGTSMPQPPSPTSPN